MKAEIVRAITGQIGELLDGIDRKGTFGAEAYAQACFLAGLEQLRRVKPEIDVIQELRDIADQSEALLSHANKMTGKFFGGLGT